MVDTHVKRISRKLGLTAEEDPEKVEYDLMKVLPRSAGFCGISISSHWDAPSVQARNPRCGDLLFKGILVQPVRSRRCLPENVPFPLKIR